MANQQETNDKRALLLESKARSYMLCLNSDCPRHENCLHCLATQYAPVEMISIRVINPRFREVMAGRCPEFRSAEPIRMPCGLTTIYHDMPGHMERGIKNAMIAALGRKRYYEYHGGKRPLDPATEALLRRLVASYGWTQDLQFNSYVEDYVW